MPGAMWTIVRITDISDCKAGPAPAFCIAISAPSLICGKVASGPCVEIPMQAK